MLDIVVLAVWSIMVKSTAANIALVLLIVFGATNSNCRPIALRNKIATEIIFNKYSDTLYDRNGSTCFVFIDKF